MDYKSKRIAILSPVAWRTPPRQYGAWETVASNITEGLVKLGTKQVDCPKCDRKAKKIMSLCAFELKGGGWYADGYSSSKK